MVPFTSFEPPTLDRLEKAGRYGVGDPFLFGERVTEDLREVSHDGHLSFHYAPAECAASIAPSSGDHGSAAQWRRQATRDHYGLKELKVLPGNIRYLRVTGFEWVTDETGAAYDDAMRFFKDDGLDHHHGRHRRSAAPAPARAVGQAHLARGGTFGRAR
jgi:hypothetical protein